MSCKVLCKLGSTLVDLNKPQIDAAVIAANAAAIGDAATEAESESKDEEDNDEEQSTKDGPESWTEHEKNWSTEDHPESTTESQRGSKMQGFNFLSAPTAESTTKQGPVSTTRVSDFLSIPGVSRTKQKPTSTTQASISSSMVTGTADYTIYPIDRNNVEAFESQISTVLRSMDSVYTSKNAKLGTLFWWVTLTQAQAKPLTGGPTVQSFRANILDFVQY